MDERKERGPFYCDVCDCELKDSANFLDHINGKRHNRNKGINVKQFTDSTLEEVEEMLEKKRKERDNRLNKDLEPDANMSVPGEGIYNEDDDDEDDDDDQADVEQADERDDD